MLGRKTDEQLVRKAIAGSESAWLSLVRRYENRLYNHALRLVGHPDDAMDLLQDVFLSVYRNLESFRGDAPFGAWIFRIATFRCTDHLRRRRYDQHEYQEQPNESNPSPFVTLETAQSNSEIVKLLALLPNEQRQVVELKFFQHFTFDEIAGQLGISTNTAKSRLYAALKKMRGSPNLARLAC
ncbi:MAG: RNA polymerase sigma factor [Proteobacteria bacterium]|nr:RNA polymerase sigma factor [Pseudomonadota bacterium]